jgi:hypothetical protein
VPNDAVVEVKLAPFTEADKVLLTVAVYEKGELVRC